MKPDVHPLRDQRGLPLDHVAQQREEALRRRDEPGVVARDRVLGELAHALHVAARRVELKGPHADVARRHAGQHRAGQRVFAVHLLARRRDREGARRGDAKRVHGLADQHLAQHGPHGGLAVAATGERRATRSLERDVATAAFPVDHLAQQEGAAIPELRREAAELVARVGLRQRLRAVRHHVSGEHRGLGAVIERVEVQPQFRRQRIVEKQQPWPPHGRRSLRNVEPRQLASERIVERECSDCGHGFVSGGHRQVCNTTRPCASPSVPGRTGGRSGRARTSGVRERYHPRCPVQAPARSAVACAPTRECRRSGPHPGAVAGPGPDDPLAKHRTPWRSSLCGRRRPVFRAARD